MKTKKHKLQRLKKSILFFFVLIINCIGISRSASAQTDFQNRCAATGVIKCVGFDSPSDIAGGYGDNSGILPGETTPTLDATQKASGASSLKFTIKSKSGSDGGGTYFTNFSDDLKTQIDGNSEFFVQWRQRINPAMLTKFSTTDGDFVGWKQIIIGTGDKPGCTNSSNGCYNSCSALETVLQGYYGENFPIMYNSCEGSTSHGAYDSFFQPYSGYDFKLQNGRPSPFCLYSQSDKGYFPSNGNCWGHVANEWVTFQIQIKTGPRQGDEFKGSYVKLWIARQGKPSELIINWGPYNLTAGDPAEGQKFGKVWLLPYMTRKNPAQVHAEGYTWYDELIISRNKIADPAGTVTSVEPGEDEMNAMIYPNPSSSNVVINLDPDKTSDIEVIDMFGKTIENKKSVSGSYQLNIENYESGLYLVRIISGNSVTLKKFVKE